MKVLKGATPQALIALDLSLVDRELERFLANLQTRGRLQCQPELVARVRERSLLRLARHLSSTPGKRVRPLLALWLARAFASPTRAHDDDVLRIAVCVEVLHAASLAVDDVQDGSAERRGEPALHTVFGMPLALNAAGWCYFAAIEWLGNDSLQTLAISTLARCHEGQGLDLSHADPAVQADLFEAGHAERLAFYDATARLKTSALMEFVSEACGVALGLPRSVVEAASNALQRYGRAFQILDDVKNFVPALSGCKTYEDLEQGLRNRVCLHLVESLDAGEKEQARLHCLQGTFRPFVLQHRNLRDALACALEEGETLRTEAALLLKETTEGRPGAFEYLEALLDKPLVELRGALLERVPARG
jgi:geranylgeranyl pyrophosphate synthase